MQFPTKQAFRDWLATLSPETRFVRGDCQQCPLAVMLQRDHLRATVGVESCTIYGVGHTLPGWAQEFVNAFDNFERMSPATPEFAISILDGYVS